MSREKFCSSAQYKAWRNELNQQKFILRHLDKNNREAIESCKQRIAELKEKMKIKL